MGCKHSTLIQEKEEAFNKIIGPKIELTEFSELSLNEEESKYLVTVTVNDKPITIRKVSYNHENKAKSAFKDEHKEITAKNTVKTCELDKSRKQSLSCNLLDVNFHETANESILSSTRSEYLEKIQTQLYYMIDKEFENKYLTAHNNSRHRRSTLKSFDY